MKDSYTNLSNHFLIAMPGMADPSFAGSMIYLCNHSEEGAMGLTVNRAHDVLLRTLFEQLGLPCSGNNADQTLLSGGPVEQGWGFVLHPNSKKSWQSTQEIGSNISLTSSRDIIEDIARDSDAPEHHLIVLGYAGWAAGQLEAELLANAWLTVPANPAFLFNTPLEQRADRAAASIGVELSKLSNNAGHA